MESGGKRVKGLFCLPWFLNSWGKTPVCSHDAGITSEERKSLMKSVICGVKSGS